MTSAKPLPRPTSSRPVGDHIRRAAIADAALGVTPYAPLDWLVGSGVNDADALTTWADAKLVETRAGHAFDVVEMPRTPGWDAIRHLRAMRAPVGPILHTAAGVLALVRVGSLTGWDLPDSRVLAVDEVIGVPHPSVVAPHTVHARTWVVPPRDELVLTDAADLYGAYAAALVSVNSAVVPAP